MRSLLWLVLMSLLSTVVADDTTIDSMSLGDPANQTASARLYRICPSTSEELQSLLHYTGRRLPLVSAHRGGAEIGLPENSLVNCEQTLRTTFALMEIDPRYTRDRQIVIHHDPTLDRTTTGKGKVSDSDLTDLRKVKLLDNQGKTTSHSIPTLDEFIEWARGKSVLLLDQKDVTLDDRMDAIEKHAAEHYVMLIIYNFQDAQKCFQRNPKIMMEVMIPNHSKLREFAMLGISWKNIIAFVGHETPQDPTLIQELHRMGVMCIAGTSRNLDRDLARVSDETARKAMHAGYFALMDLGIDLIETDLPQSVGKLLSESRIPPEFSRILMIDRDSNSPLER